MRYGGHIGNGSGGNRFFDFGIEFKVYLLSFFAAETPNSEHYTFAVNNNRIERGYFDGKKQQFAEFFLVRVARLRKFVGKILYLVEYCLQVHPCLFLLGGV